MLAHLASLLLIGFCAVCHVHAFALSSSNRFASITTPTSIVGSRRSRCTSSSLPMTYDPEAVVEVPTYLPSVMGVDYVPLATMLAIGDYEGADAFTRDALIKIAGPGAVKRNFVYWTEVKTIPAVDLCTIERLWLQFSEGNFGYSVQKRVWDVENGNFDKYIRRIGWTTIDNGNERNLKWFGKSEFIYDLSAPKGHLPLTSALRGTQLMKALMSHPVWVQFDWKNYKDLKWEK